jgi:hypothetical protein
MSDIEQRAKFQVKFGTKLADFITSKRYVDIIEGPLGSGKTYALCARIMRHAQEQRKSPLDGIRYTQFAMVRNTMPDLKRSTIRTWLRLFPEKDVDGRPLYGRFNYGAAMHHHIRFGDIDCMVDFISLDKDEDVRKLRSTEYTGIFFDELEFIEKVLFDEARSRLRYPPPEHGGPTWRGVCAATNAPPEDHWLPIMTGRVEFPQGLKADELSALQWPPEWGWHLQPPALIEQVDQHGVVVGYRVNPNAENLEHLPATYYQEQLIAQKKDWIDSRLMVRTVLVTDGSPVWTSFRRETHVSRQLIRPRVGYPVYVGLDFGRSPAAVFIQCVNNRVLVLDELIGAAEGAERFAPKVKRHLVQRFAGLEVIAFGDPKGQDKTQNDERTAYDIFRHNGIDVQAPPGLKQNMIETRVNAVDHMLNEMSDGIPRFCISPNCRTLIVAMAGRYCNERDEEGELRPKKDRYSNIADALQYAALGVGEGRAMIGLGPISRLRAVQTYHRGRSMRRIEV